MPALVEYNRAIQRWSQSGRIAEPRLRDGRVKVTGRRQTPWCASGQYAVVYQFVNANGQPVAFRCFLSEQTIPKDAPALYSGMAQAFRRADIEPWTVQLAWHDPGIEVPLADGSMKPCPILEMPWVDGVEIHDWVHARVYENDGGSLLALYAQWCDLAARMRMAGIAHGDLSARNILVRPDGVPVLVDYDDLYAEELPATGRAMVAGTAGFQHPRAFDPAASESRAWDERADDFSALVIATALRGVAILPELWLEFVAASSETTPPERLLFTEEDLADPHSSALFEKLRVSSDAELGRLVPVLEVACAGSIADVPSYFDPPKSPSLIALEAALQRDDDLETTQVVREHCSALLGDARMTDGLWRRVGQARQRQLARDAVAAAGTDAAAQVRAWLTHGAISNGPISWAPDDARLTALLDTLGPASAVGQP